jgi:hypothetical protein
MAFYIVTLIAIGAQYLISQTSKVGGAIAGYLGTTIILIWGLNIYSSGGFLERGGC